MGLAIAMQASRNGDTQPIRVATVGVFEFDCVSATFEVGKLIGVDVTTHNETPGLGAKAKTDPKFAAQFKGLPASGAVKVTQDGGSVNAISGSTESQGEVTVRLQNSGRVVNGVGSDPDIVVASAKAYLSALNKLQSKSDRVAAQG